jgi:hypothetical protein
MTAPLYAIGTPGDGRLLYEVSGPSRTQIRKPSGKWSWPRGRKSRRN